MRNRLGAEAARNRSCGEQVWRQAAVAVGRQRLQGTGGGGVGGRGTCAVWGQMAVVRDPLQGWGKQVEKQRDFLSPQLPVTAFPTVAVG